MRDLEPSYARGRQGGEGKVVVRSRQWSGYNRQVAAQDHGKGLSWQ